MCQRGNAQSVDFYLRKRLCNPCRKQHWIKVDSSLLKLHPTLHQDVVDACLTTNYTPSQTTMMWPGSKNYAFLPDVQDISSKLRELEEEDAIDLEYKSLGYSLASEAGNSPGRSHRSHRTRTSSAANDDSKDDGSEGDDSEDDDRASDSRSAGGDDQEGGTRVEKFLKERKVLRSSAIKDAKLLTPAYRKLKMLTKLEKTTIKRDEQTEGWSRRRAIEAKVLALDEGYTRNDFAGAWYKSKITTSAEPLTNEVWDEIKPKVIKLLARIKAQQEQAEVINDQQTRQRALRPRYDKLRETQPNDDARASLPLFADFLELESVKPFWESEDADSMDDDAWQENLEGLLEEIDDYRLSVRLHAVKTILNATTEIAEEDLTGDADEFGPEQYDDDFLERPTSFLVCTLPNCRRKKSWSRRLDGTYLRVPERTVFFGSLADLLKHQHECHPNVTFTNKQLAQRSKNGVVGHFALPPAVVSALSALIEVGELEDDTATAEELEKVTTPYSSLKGRWDEIRDRITWLDWENSPSGKRYSRDWRELIGDVIKQDEKATKSKRLLEVPTIALRGRQIDREERARERKSKKKKSKKRGPHPWDYSDDE
ncbi:hypothetical protein BCR35DRAFT_305254 [Leucosporidium creatinivorum]|uniref:Uncharacterized protein n=1 Tax=Leucosporidium creatinivorum TaxID=106004 RepID=A0A1Y2F2I3_9BASI|nr:hypothetical protein BCR35DRAFT_305254 [Leucosporidium creatinivorum]